MKVFYAMSFASEVSYYEFLAETKDELFNFIREKNPEVLPEKYIEIETGKFFETRLGSRMIFKSKGRREGEEPKDIFVIGSVMHIGTSLRFFVGEEKGEGWMDFRDEYKQYNKKFNILKGNSCYLGRCADPYDIFTMDELDDANDVVFFFEFDQDERYVATHCFSKEGLIGMIDSGDYRLAKWVPNYGRNSFEDMGFGGHADLDVVYFGLTIAGFQRYVKILDRYQHPVYKVELNRLRKKIPAFIMKNTGKVRLGNLESSFGASLIHGQIPGEDTYDLEYVKYKDLKRLFEYCKGECENCDSFIDEDIGDEADEFEPEDTLDENRAILEAHRVVNNRIDGTLDLSGQNITELPEDLYVGGNLDLHGTPIEILPRGLVVRGNLDLRGTPIKELPVGLYVGGWLDLSWTQIEKLAEGISVWQWLDLRGTQIKELPEGLSIGGYLDLRETQIEKLPEGLSIGGSLNLMGTPIKELPEGLKVGGSLYLEGTQIEELPIGLSVGGNLDVEGTSIREIPADSHIGGRIFPRGLQRASLDLSGTRVTRLPEGPHVGGGISAENRRILEEHGMVNNRVEGNLDLRGSGITELPEGLSVEGWLDLERTPIEKLPEGLSVKGSLVLRGTQITKLPEGFSARGSLILEGTQIEKLPEGFSVRGSLNLMGTPIKELPEGLSVARSLNLKWTQIEKLPKGLFVGENLDVEGTSIREIPADSHIGGRIFPEGLPRAAPREGVNLEAVSVTWDPSHFVEVLRNNLPIPDNLTVSGGLNLEDEGLHNLPDGLTVQGDLDISYNPISELPERLTVERDFYLNDTGITIFSDDLRVGGDAYINENQIEDIGESQIEGDVYIA